jgi:replicative DNA helicase
VHETRDASDSLNAATATAQHPPIGPEPGLEELFIGALMYSTPAEVVKVSRFIEADDLGQPAGTVLASIKALVGRGVPPSPQLVKDDLHRRGKLTRSIATWLAGAMTSGACASAASAYAAAVLAGSFRRQAESIGVAIRSARILPRRVRWRSWPSRRPPVSATSMAAS